MFCLWHTRMEVFVVAQHNLWNKLLLHKTGCEVCCAVLFTCQKNVYIWFGLQESLLVFSWIVTAFSSVPSCTFDINLAILGHFKTLSWSFLRLSLVLLLDGSSLLLPLKLSSPFLQQLVLLIPGCQHPHPHLQQHVLQLPERRARIKMHKFCLVVCCVWAAFSCSDPEWLVKWKGKRDYAEDLFC